LNEETTGKKDEPTVITPGRVKKPGFLQESTSDASSTPTKPESGPGKIKKPAFLENQETSNSKPDLSSSTGGKSVGKIKQPAFLQGGGDTSKVNKAAPPKGGPGKIKKPAFLEKIDDNPPPRPKGFGKSGGLPSKKAQKVDEDEYEYEEEGGDEDGDYEYEYEYE